MVRARTNRMEQLAKLKPFFDRKYGTITVANACPITDGAAAVLLMSRAKARNSVLRRARSQLRFCWVGARTHGSWPGLRDANRPKARRINFKDMGLVELNEAFAAQVLACVKALSSDKFCKEKLGLDKKVGDIDMNTLSTSTAAQLRSAIQWGRPAPGW